MVQIPKSTGQNVAVGKFSRVTGFRKFGKSSRGRIGVQLVIDGKNVWFNDYGTEDELAEKYEPVLEGDEIAITYNERRYTLGDNTERVSRDIKSFERTGEGTQKRVGNTTTKSKTKTTTTHDNLSDKDVEAFMPVPEVNRKLIMAELDRIEHSLAWLRGVFVHGKEE